MNSTGNRSEVTKGVVYGLSAYLFWGANVIYFKAVADVSASEVLAHRVIWSALLLAVFLAARGRWRASVQALRSRRIVLLLVASAALIALNWFVYAWAVANDRVLQTSLGYYINPLVNVGLGFALLGERLRRLQVASIGLAIAGVALLVITRGGVPAVALVLALTFSLYGLLRKKAGVEGRTGLAFEMLVLFPLAIGYLIFLVGSDRSAFLAHGRGTDLLLLAAGPVSALPLLWFVNAAPRLRYATLGLMMYITPTISFVLALVAYHEPFDRTQLVTFCFVWVALAIYSWDSLREARGNGYRTRVNPRALARSPSRS